VEFGGWVSFLAPNLMSRHLTRLQRSYIVNCIYHKRLVTKTESNSAHLFTANEEGKICTWNWQDGALLGILEDSPDGYRKLALPSQEECLTIRPTIACGRPGTGLHPSEIRGIVSAGRYLISLGFDGVLRIWDDEISELHSERLYGDRFWTVVGGNGNIGVFCKKGHGEFGFESWVVEVLREGSF
jgi:hypothetical protein